ncbi:aminotransferase [Streptomyces sp. PT12]|nr:aminotransferase [Streptomyces sp. PT12]
MRGVAKDMEDVFDKRIAPILEKAMGEISDWPYFRALTPNGPGEVIVDGRPSVMAGCNDYLGLSCDPRVTEAAAEAVRRYGASCSGSRSLNGTMALHEELEHRIAVFLERPAALVTTTGFQANLMLTALLERGDTVFSDMSNHASLVDAVRLSPAARRRYRHRDLDHLERLLSAAGPDTAKLIVTDGLFSMEGDVCPLPGLGTLAGRYGARLIVDGAHDIGLLGEHGRGVAEHFGLMDAVDLQTGTLSKCFGSLGGFVAGPEHLVRFLRYTARPFVFTAAMSPASAAAALAALTVIETEPDRRQRVFNHAERLHNGLRALGYTTSPSVTPVVPVHIGDELLCLRTWQELLDHGVYTNAVIPPGVPSHRSLIRVTAQATHTDEQITRILDAFAAVGRQLGLVPRGAPEDYEPVDLVRPRRHAAAPLPAENP